MTFPDFHPDPAPPGDRCLVHVHDKQCTATAEWHIHLGHDTDGNQKLTFACDPHMAMVQSGYVYAARHPFGPACGQTSWEMCAAESTWQAPDGDEQRTLAVSAERATAALDKLGEQLAFGLHPDLQGPDEEPTT